MRLSIARVRRCRRIERPGRWWVLGSDGMGHGREEDVFGVGRMTVRVAGVLIIEGGYLRWI